ncbi:MAG: RNA polymerase sigma factor [Candidatus Hydrogenedentes bacterium]|nr:RNA polymerase sigma factor [Candidatus Hydrogenedentota bacterium]
MRAAQREEQKMPSGIRDEDIAAFETLCREIEAPLYSYIRKLLPGSPDAEDIAQEALLRLFAAMHNGRLRKSPRAYLFSIAHNLAVDACRARKHQPVPDAPPAVSAAANAHRSLLREQMEHALGELPQDQRSALLLREFGGLSYAEIAETMKVDTGLVKIWLFRARQKLSTLLDHDGQYVGIRNHE